MTKYLGLHETLETLELIAFKTVCLTKAVTMSKLLPDGDLKTILSGDLESGSQGLKQLQTFITNREETHND
ncbi:MULTISPECIES: hypothetical protein [Bacillaceae]|jgi:similar to spore coat protein|uniref:Spore coat protein n=1 Tax=Cytobacillus oceanisediminis 2691 TaxID=1196031 RepID=A0A160MCZ6_9BACI|nr:MULTISPECIES: hypothetical protein [Cytobacillus]EFV79574.1 hypothetical protein HMPREF1013_00173 [Bacillus sp. 2_A_57_CT2]AND40543.1 hypothetical protein A361_15765 [Cytobacillus oceanisediminis 2691]MCM3243065.1 hypothetical protein [Cytobacillus oceanisediminis]MCM3401014.1 hypothetical protein [Cytobacillus oceanisediminis]MDK7665309.1 hypothetical protein [Cytobacillus oceanisediminis]